MANPIPKWAVRAAAAQVLSRLPGGEDVRYLVQRYVTRTLPFIDEELVGRFLIGCEHLAAIAKYNPSLKLKDAHFFEFGAGWNVGMGLFLAAAGVGRQTLVDLNRFVRPELVQHTLLRLREIAQNPPKEFPKGLLDVARLPTSFEVAPYEVDGALREIGIDYRAPSDARRTGLPGDTIDCVTSSLTLEHIPLPDIKAIFKELYRLLKPGGLFVSKVDMTDHYSHSDKSINTYHYLRFSEAAWNLINADMLYQNRLRASAFIDAATEVGFEMIEIDRRYPKGAPPETIPMPEVHPSFTGYKDRNDLLCHKLYFVARKN